MRFGRVCSVGFSRALLPAPPVSPTDRPRVFLYSTTLLHYEHHPTSIFGQTQPEPQPTPGTLSDGFFSFQIRATSGTLLLDALRVLIDCQSRQNAFGQSFFFLDPVSELMIETVCWRKVV
jgi:hypothetical protein